MSDALEDPESPRATPFRTGVVAQVLADESAPISSPFDERGRVSTVPPILEPPEPTKVFQPRSELRSRRALVAEANEAVPNVSQTLVPPPPPVAEASESGHVPARELDRVMADMHVLFRYGHHGQVRAVLERLFRRYPEDLLLLRRVAEFHIQSGDREGAKTALFTLAGRLFERRNILGMQRALEQVLVLEPGNVRATKLLGLLEER